MKRPTDTSTRIFFTYPVPGDERLHLDIAPHYLVRVTTLLATTHSSLTRQSLTLSEKIHCYTRALANETRAIFFDASVLDESPEASIEKVLTACEICTSSDRPSSSTKISLPMSKKHSMRSFKQISPFAIYVEVSEHSCT